MGMLKFEGIAPTSKNNGDRLILSTQRCRARLKTNHPNTIPRQEQRKGLYVTDPNNDETTHIPALTPITPKGKPDLNPKAPWADNNDQSSKRSKAKIIIAGAGIAAILALAGGGAYAYASQSAHATALSTCESSITTVKKTMALWNDAKNDASETVKVTADQVADSDTVEALNKIYSTQDSQPQSCPTDAKTSKLNEAADRNKKTADKFSSLVKKIDPAVEAVQTSQTLKTLNDAISSGQSLLDSSNGHVKDESTRDALQTALNDAKTISGDVKATSQQMNEAKSKIDDAANAVNQSVQDRQADEQAAASQDQTSAEQNNQDQARSSSAGSSGSGTSSNSNRKSTSANNSSGSSKNATGNTGNSGSGSSGSGTAGQSAGSQSGNTSSNQSNSQSGNQSSGGSSSQQQTCNGTLENGHCWVDFGPGYSGQGWAIQ